MELKNPENNEIEFEVSDEVLKTVIDAKLSSFDMDTLDKLESKTVKRLLEAEFFIQYSNERISQSIEEIKNNIISKSNLDKSSIITCSRKTFYNDKVLKEYIEKCIENKPDYFNSKVLKDTQENYNKLLDLYDKLYVKIIDTQNLKAKIKELEKEITDIYEEKNNLIQCIHDKDKEIYELKRKLNINKVIQFKSQ
ncbi:hypothetical protein [Terrisporobacter sp.]|uniref:hypothetical protein n=1 Tax=Terrisporobacter sp. TaxID=1965305 RepID=UPI00260EA05E|nr:hypothetical protein [Terrisporobacter sp.]